LNKHKKEKDSDSDSEFDFEIPVKKPLTDQTTKNTSSVTASKITDKGQTISSQTPNISSHSHSSAIPLQTTVSQSNYGQTNLPPGFEQITSKHILPVNEPVDTNKSNIATVKMEYKSASVDTKPLQQTHTKSVPDKVCVFYNCDIDNLDTRVPS